MNPASETIHNGMDEKLQKWFRLLSIVMVGISPIGVTIPIFGASLFAYYFTELGNDAFLLPFPIWWTKIEFFFVEKKFFKNDCFSSHFFFETSRLPFDWQHPVGYSFAIVLLYIFIFNASFTAICVVVFSVGICLILISLTNDIINELESLDKSAKIKKNRSRTVKRFVRVVRIHSISMQLSDFLLIFFLFRKFSQFNFNATINLNVSHFRLAHDFSKFTNFMCTILLGWGAAAICGLMLMLQMELV